MNLCLIHYHCKTVNDPLQIFLTHKTGGVLFLLICCASILLFVSQNNYYIYSLHLFIFVRLCYV